MKKVKKIKNRNFYIKHKKSILSWSVVILLIGIWLYEIGIPGIVKILGGLGGLDQVFFVIGAIFFLFSLKEFLDVKFLDLSNKSIRDLIPIIIIVPILAIFILRFFLQPQIDLLKLKDRLCYQEEMNGSIYKSDPKNKKWSVYEKERLEDCHRIRSTFRSTTNIPIDSSTNVVPGQSIIEGVVAPFKYESYIFPIEKN